jgi:hypothetical protein
VTNNTTEWKELKLNKTFALEPQRSLNINCNKQGELRSRGAQFDFRPGTATMLTGFRGFTRFLQATSGTVHQIHKLQLPAASFRTHYLLITLGILPYNL